MPNFHIRVHDVLDSSSGIVTWLHKVSKCWVLTAEGSFYDKVQHRHIRPHYHCWLRYGGTHTTLRERFKLAFPHYSGNKSYSIKSQKKEGDNLLSYILKGGNIIGFSGITLDELNAVPDWVDKKTHFRKLLKQHLTTYLIDNNYHDQKNYLNNQQLHTFFVQISKFAKTREKWVTKLDYYRLAYELGVIDASQFTYYLL